MIINVVAQGDPDTTPIRYSFQQDDVFTTSVSNTRDLLNQGHKININQAILLLADTVVNLVRSGHNKANIQQSICSLIRPEQVMIGVPEMTRHLEFDIGSDYTIAICKPIPWDNTTDIEHRYSHTQGGRHAKKV